MRRSSLFRLRALRRPVSWWHASWLLGAAVVTSCALSSPSALAGAKAKRPADGCVAPAKSASTSKTRASDAKARLAAQKGLSFLAQTAPKWASSHNCYGCHVHAVTLEAFVVGKHHKYDVDDKAMNSILQGMLTGPGGVRGTGGLHYAHGGLQAPSKAFGGAALAHYDHVLGDDVRDDLLQTARELMAYQDASSGRLNTSWTNGPVGVGDVQTTYQALQTWRQAYARTADTAWLAPLRRGESFLTDTAASFEKAPPNDLQQLNYALLGLVEAGAQSTERSVALLRGHVLERQNKDGGWALHKGGRSEPFATGQTLYTLRKLGLTDADAAVRKGTAWLMQNQQTTGGWSSGGRSKAEAMWGVLGLVSIDVLSIDVGAVADGQHLSGTRHVKVAAKDNKGRGVRRVTLYVDDVVVESRCGPTLMAAIDAKTLKEGMHLIDVVAENATGQTSSRRLTVYTGDIYLTEVGSEHRTGQTWLSARNITDSAKGKVQLRIYEEKLTKDGPVKGKSVYTQTVTSKMGPVSVAWDGKGASKGAQKKGRYIAEFVFVDDKRGEVQKVEHVFTHMSEAEQKKNFAEVQGKLDLGARGGAANTTVELVDDEGRVVQSVKSTRGGNYRFKNVDKGKYKVRVRKKGFKAREAEVQAAPAAPAASAEFDLEEE